MKVPNIKSGTKVTAVTGNGDRLEGLWIKEDNQFYVVHNNSSADGSAPADRHGYNYGWIAGWDRRVGDETTQFTSIKKVGVDMSRATYRLKKETAEYKKDALFQEDCDDGDQDFTLLDESQDLVKYKYCDGALPTTIPRGAIVGEPTYFERVYLATETYLTKEEMAALKEFLKNQKKSKKGK